MTHHTSEIMSKKLWTVSSSAKIKQAYDLMSAKNIRHLPVTDVSGQIIGIISDRDIQRAMRPTKGTAKPGTTAEYGADLTLDFDPNFEVKDFMSFPIEKVDKHSTVESVAARMLNEKISAFLVTSEGRASGIVTTDDMLKLLLELLRKEPTSLRRTLDGFVETWETAN